MTHKQRFHDTIDRKPVDRPASWLGLPAPDAHKGLFDHFNVDTVAELKVRIDDDVYPVELPYFSPTGDAIYMAFDFAQHGIVDEEHRTLNTPGVFENCTDPARIDEFDWPDPAKHISVNECRQVVDDVPEDYAVLAVVWSAHFQDACAAFGMENAFVQMYAAPEMFRSVIDRITEFYVQANEIFYAATRGKVDAVLIGNDFGMQSGLLLSPEAIREFALPGTRKLIDQAKNYGLKVFHHSCGAIRDIIPDLIQAGVDVVHPIQPLADGMGPEGLKQDFGDSISFCGGVDAQNLLVNGTPLEVKHKVRQLKELFPTGLIISPSHEAILPDIPPENIEALFEEVREW